MFVVGVWRDPRSFSNAVFPGLCLALGALGAVGAAHQLPGASGDLARLLVVALGLLVVLGPFLVASYLVLNGITMARRESMRPGNLLSLLADVCRYDLHCGPSSHSQIWPLIWENSGYILAQSVRQAGPAVVAGGGLPFPRPAASGSLSPLRQRRRLLYRPREERDA